MTGTQSQAWHMNDTPRYYVFLNIMGLRPKNGDFWKQRFESLRVAVPSAELTLFVGAYVKMPGRESYDRFTLCAYEDEVSSIDSPEGLKRYHEVSAQVDSAITAIEQEVL